MKQQQEFMEARGILLEKVAARRFATNYLSSLRCDVSPAIENFPTHTQTTSKRLLPVRCMYRIILLLVSGLITCLRGNGLAPKVLYRQKGSRYRSVYLMSFDLFYLYIVSLGECTKLWSTYTYGYLLQLCHDLCLDNPPSLLVHKTHYYI